MSHFRRAYVPAGSFFFTVVTERRAPILCTDTSRVFLRTAIRECRERWPFLIDAMVFLDKRLHAILTDDISDDLSDDKLRSMDDAPQLIRMAGQVACTSNPFTSIFHAP